MNIDQSQNRGLMSLSQAGLPAGEGGSAVEAGLNHDQHQESFNQKSQSLRKQM